MRSTEKTPVRSARRLLAAVLAVTAGTGAACSLGNVKQNACTSDDQCAAAFGAGSTCAAGYCTDSTVSPSCQGTSDAGLACYACAPATVPEFENACSGATCVPFDDTRLTKLLPDGGLPPLP